MFRVSRFALAFLFSIGLIDVGWTSTGASGTVTVTQGCEAFQSKNTRSNPGDVRLVVGNTYPVFEANKATDPDWFRVRIENAEPPERWVSAGCGRFDVALRGDAAAVEEEHRDACNTAGLEDGYLLALSWQPAFCEGHRSKPECRIDDPKSYQARNFTLHGLWPNRASCGIRYEFCGAVREKRDDFCDYPDLALASDVRADLERVMPSAAEGSCLQRHEWFKHGTCQKDWHLDDYYEIAVNLTRQFNESGIAYFIAQNIGSTLSEEALIDRVDCALGSGAHSGLELKCENGNLVDVYVRLPATVDRNAGIGELMRQAPGQFKSNCGGRFKVDPIGF